MLNNYFAHEKYQASSPRNDDFRGEMMIFD